MTPISTRTRTAGHAIPTGGGDAGVMAITRDGRTVYAVRFVIGPDTTQGSVTPIDTATNTAGKQILAGANPVAIAITP